MRILLLSDVNSPHTQRWAAALAERGYVIGIFSLSKPINDWYKASSQIELLSRKGFSKNLFNQSVFHKLSFFMSMLPIRNAIKSFEPDIVHAHYASSYGLLGALTSFKPFIISAWGTDIYHFPNINLITKNILKFSLNRAKRVTASSKHLAEATKKITKAKVEVVPFGIDTKQFFPERHAVSDDKTIVIGAVKSLEKVYGMDTLIKAFSKCKTDLPEFNLKLRLIGEGSEQNLLMQLAKDLKIEEHVEFVGRIDYDQVADEYRKLDIFANLSRFESFGVSVLEASACGIPCVITNAGGLTEVGKHDETCLYVAPENTEAAAKALMDLIINKNKRLILGRNARKFVEDHFTIQSCTDKMERIYNSILKE